MVSGDRMIDVRPVAPRSFVRWVPHSSMEHGALTRDADHWT